MEYLRRFTTEVGFSDHSLVSRDGLIGSKAALALGATSIERHFTVLSPEDTKDGPVSINPQNLNDIVAKTEMIPNILEDNGPSSLIEVKPGHFVAQSL